MSRIACIAVPLLLASCGSPVEPAWPQVAEFELGTPFHMSYTFAAYEQIDLGDRVVWAKDTDGNDLGADDLATIPDGQVGWAWHDRHPDATMPVPSEPSWWGWEAAAPDFTEAGYLQNSRGAYLVCIHVWITGAGPEALEGFGAAPQPDDTLPPP